MVRKKSTSRKYPCNQFIRLVDDNKMHDVVSRTFVNSTTPSPRNESLALPYYMHNANALSYTHHMIHGRFAQTHPGDYEQCEGQHQDLFGLGLDGRLHEVPADVRHVMHEEDDGAEAQVAESQRYSDQQHGDGVMHVHLCLSALPQREQHAL